MYKLASDNKEEHPGGQPMSNQGRFILSDGHGPGSIKGHENWDEQSWATWSDLNPGATESSFQDDREEQSIDNENCLESPGTRKRRVSWDAETIAPENSPRRHPAETSPQGAGARPHRRSDLGRPRLPAWNEENFEDASSDDFESRSLFGEDSVALPEVLQLHYLCSRIDSDESWEHVRDWLRVHSATDIKAAIEFRGEANMTALHFVCRAGFAAPLDIIEVFLSVAPETANWPDSFGYRPLHYASGCEAPAKVIAALEEAQACAKQNSLVRRPGGSGLRRGLSWNGTNTSGQTDHYDDTTSQASFRTFDGSTFRRRSARSISCLPRLGGRGFFDDAQSVATQRTSYSEGDQDQLPEDLLMFFQAGPLVYTDMSYEVKSLERLDFESEKEALKEAIEEVVGSRLALSFEIVTPNLLSRFLTEGAGRVLHFSCHGHPKSLFVEDGWGHAQPLFVEDLGNWIRDGGKRLELVFVSACHSRTAGEHFVRAGVPHVVCCQTDSQRLHNLAAVEFEKAFYRALLCGAKLREAFELARHQVLNSADIPLEMRRVEAGKFALLPKDADHDVKIFFTEKSMKPTSFLRKRDPPNSAFCRPPSPIIGRQVEMFRIIHGLHGSGSRLVRVSGDPGVGTEIVVQACLEYLAERRSVNKFEELIWAPRTDSSEISNYFTNLYKCLREEQRQDLPSGSMSGGNSCMLEILEYFRLRESKSLLVLDAKDISAAGGIQFLFFFIKSLLRESRHVKIIVLQRPGIEISLSKMPCTATDVHVPPLNLKETATLFALSCQHVRDRISCDVGTVSDFADLVASDEITCPDGRMSKRCSAYYKMLGEGNPKRVREFASQMSPDNFKKLIEMARCPRAPLPSVNSRVELDRKLQDLNAELARAIDNEEYSLAHQIQERFQDLELLRQQYPTLLELETMADDVERKKERAIEDNDFLRASRLHQELQQLEIKIRTERIAKAQSDNAAQASAPSRVAQGERPALLRSPPSFQNRVSNVAPVNVDDSSTEHSGQTVGTGNILPVERQRDSEISDSLDTSEGFGDDTNMQPRPRLSLGWITAAEVPYVNFEGLDSLPVLQSNSFEPMQDAPPKRLPSSASSPRNGVHSELARQQGPSNDKVADCRPDDKNRPSGDSDEKTAEKHSSRVRPEATEQPPGDTKETKYIDDARREGAIVEENVENSANKTDRVQAQDSQEIPVPVNDYVFHSPAGGYSVFSDSTSNDEGTEAAKSTESTTEADIEAQSVDRHSHSSGSPGEALDEIMQQPMRRQEVDPEPSDRRAVLAADPKAKNKTKQLQIAPGTSPPPRSNDSLPVRDVSTATHNPWSYLGEGSDEESEEPESVRPGAYRISGYLSVDTEDEDLHEDTSPISAPVAIAEAISAESEQDRVTQLVNEAIANHMTTVVTAEAEVPKKGLLRRIFSRRRRR